MCFGLCIILSGFRKYRHKVFVEPYRSMLKPEIKKKFFWGGKLWTQSFFVETIGNANEEGIRKYVREQLNKMDSQEEKRKQLRLL